VLCSNSRGNFSVTSSFVLLVFLTRRGDESPTSLLFVTELSDEALALRHQARNFVLQRSHHRAAVAHRTHGAGCLILAGAPPLLESGALPVPASDLVEL
jgi:hypothetical protein